MRGKVHSSAEDSGCGEPLMRCDRSASARAASRCSFVGHNLVRNVASRRQSTACAEQQRFSRDHHSQGASAGGSIWSGEQRLSACQNTGVGALGKPFQRQGAANDVVFAAACNASPLALRQ